MRFFNYTKPSPFCQYTNLAPFLDNSSTSKPKPTSLSFSFYRHLKRSLVIQSVAKHVIQSASEESPGKVVLPYENTRPSTVISSAVERSPKAKQYPTVISSVVEKSPKAKQYYPCKIPDLTVIQSASAESPGKEPLFVPHARGSLDFARDDDSFPCCHSEG